MNGKIFNSQGILVGVVVGDEIFGLKGQKLYDLKGSNIYKLNGDLVGHSRQGEAFGQNDRQVVPGRLARSADLPKCQALRTGDWTSLIVATNSA